MPWEQDGQGAGADGRSAPTARGRRVRVAFPGLLRPAPQRPSSQETRQRQQRPSPLLAAIESLDCDRPRSQGEAGNAGGGGGDAEPPPLSNISLGRGWACWHKPVFQARSLSAQGTWVSSATVTRFRVKESLGGPGREPLPSSHAFISHLLHQEYPLSFQMFADSWGPRTATHTDSSRETPRPAQAARMASEPGQEAAFLFRAATYRGCSHRTPPRHPRPLRGGNAISRKPALGTQLGGGSLYLRGSKEYRKDHTETLEVPRELLGTVGDTRATVSHPPPTQGSRPDLSSHTRT